MNMQENAISAPSQLVVAGYTEVDESSYCDISIPRSMSPSGPFSFEISFATDAGTGKCFAVIGAIGLWIREDGQLGVDDVYNSYDTGIFPEVGVDINLIFCFFGASGASDQGLGALFVNGVLVWKQQIATNKFANPMFLGKSRIFVQYLKIYDYCLATPLNIENAFLKPSWMPAQILSAGQMCSCDLTSMPPNILAASDVSIKFTPSSPRVIQLIRAGQFDGASLCFSDSISIPGVTNSQLILFRLSSEGAVDPNYVLYEFSSADSTNIFSVSISHGESPELTIAYGNLSSLKTLTLTLAGKIFDDAFHSLLFRMTKTANDDWLDVVLDGVAIHKETGLLFPSAANYNSVMIGNSYLRPVDSNFVGCIQALLTSTEILPDNAGALLTTEGPESIPGISFFTMLLVSPVMDQVSGEILESGGVEPADIPTSDEMASRERGRPALSRSFKPFPSGLFGAESSGQHVALGAKVALGKNVVDLAQLHDRNYEVGKAKYERIGGGDIRRAYNAETGVTVFSVYNEETGERENIELSGLDDRTAWIIQVVVTVVTTVLSVIGVGFAAKGIFNALAANKGFLQWSGYSIRSIIAILKDVNLSGLTFIKILQTLSQSGTLLSVITNGLANISWWRWVIVVAQTVAAIVAIWLSGGAYLMVMAAQLAISLYQLTELVREGRERGWIN